MACLLSAVLDLVPIKLKILCMPWYVANVGSILAANYYSSLENYIVPVRLHSCNVYIKWMWQHFFKAFIIQKCINVYFSTSWCISFFL